MKVTSIMNLMKKSRMIELSKADGRQWISNGEAAYAIHCLPPMDDSQLCSVAGITDKAAQGMDINTDAPWHERYNDDFGNGEPFAPVERRTNAMYITAGSIIALFLSAKDNILIDTRYLKPLPDYDNSDNLAFYIREDPETRARFLQVKAGLTAVATISEFVPDESFAKEIELMYKVMRLK